MIFDAERIGAFSFGNLCREGFNATADFGIDQSQARERLAEPLAGA